MGFRMSAKLEGSDEWLGDDHKLYGYWGYGDVKNSFDILHPLMKEQWDDIEDDPGDAYDIFCCYIYTDELVVDEETFRRFAEAYIDDLISTAHSTDGIGCISQYMRYLAERKGNKILEWS